MRGDGPACAPVGGDGVQFSPHAWGWSASAAWGGPIGGVFPTCVGMVRPSILDRVRHRSFPHMRGDGPE